MTGEVGNVAALMLWALTGAAVFRGTVGPTHLEMHIEGSHSHTEEECEFWVNANLTAEVGDDTLTGTISYEKQPQPGSTCSVASGCSSVQEFIAVRPPS